MIRELIRAQDRAVCFELHPADFALLREGFEGDSRFSLRREDGLAGLKGLVPPQSRRGCIFIDPSYEVKDDYETLPQVLKEALRRFAGGVYIIWYPLLGNRGAGCAEELLGLYGAGSGPKVRCRVEMRTEAARERGMYGYGLVIFNPPWTLRSALEESMPGLTALLGNERAEWDVEWRE
jgi:23S rRNA (adenine2030-N6)-methyltransferase